MCLREKEPFRRLSNGSIRRAPSCLFGPRPSRSQAPPSGAPSHHFRCRRRLCPLRGSWPQKRQTGDVYVLHHLLVSQKKKKKILSQALPRHRGPGISFPYLPRVGRRRPGSNPPQSEKRQAAPSSAAGRARALKPSPPSSPSRRSRSHSTGHQRLHVALPSLAPTRSSHATRDTRRACAGARTSHSWSTDRRARCRRARWRRLQRSLCKSQPT